ncbi:hypothetical protein Poli38472_014335 [Pythium oligandrum]|uniref:Uncharacterized protein n=1 Tax=Pythium oligandrum TaxID=41045 RepID=A0A8K1C838_PYTOL|nr:hypothetical protein Poli38472_014335 [Pythium oligandrum]|eukprot:TMW57732.1 hypothetical protein Poli38472_014335 [Pythium oligandrum]
MESPPKNEKLIQEERLETGSDGMPKEIWDDMKKNENFIYYSLIFLNGSVLWTYQSCLSAQDFYAVEFAGTGYDFSFLVTLCTSWPMVLGHGLQMLFGLDKRFGQEKRVYAGYSLFALMAILIMIFSATSFSNLKTGAVLVLVCIGCIGFGNTLSEATFYLLAALFPVEKFTIAVQIGNGCAGVFNVTVLTILRLIVGGTKQEKSAHKLTFYLFFSLLLIVLVTAVWLYRRLIALPCIKFLLERNEEATKEHGMGSLNPLVNLKEFARIFRVIWVPALTQWLIFFVSLAVFPGFGCAAGRNLGEPFTSNPDKYITPSKWYCSPGIIGSYNYGDFIGRIICTAGVYKLFGMKLSGFLSVVRIAYIPIMLMGVAGTSLYIFGDHVEGALVWNVMFNLTIGLTNGVLSTVTMGAAPRMLPPQDRETGGAIMVFFLFLGIASGAHFGFAVSANAWLGL